MSISHAILGILSCKPLTGYDLKKIMQDSSFMYWSGNNNQIYKVLLELSHGGLVTNETHHQDGAPSKKVYTITDAGMAELKRWSLTAPEAPEIKKAFLVQLAWTWQLNNAELGELLDRYEQEIKGQLFIVQSKNSKEHFAPNRTPRESAVWGLIYANITDSFQQELSWIERVRQQITQFCDIDHSTAHDVVQNKAAEDECEMSYQIIDKNTEQYILLDTAGKQLQTEQDGLDLVSICAMNGTNRVLIPGERLSDDFFRLRTGIAGAILQKFAMYNIKVAVVLDKERAKGKFKDFLEESNRGKVFHACSNMTDAVNWLLKPE